MKPLLLSKLLKFGSANPKDEILLLKEILNPSAMQSYYRIIEEFNLQIYNKMLINNLSFSIKNTFLGRSYVALIGSKELLLAIGPSNIL